MVKYYKEDWIEFRGKTYYRDDFPHLCSVIKELEEGNDELISEIRDMKTYILQLTEELDKSNATGQSLKKEVEALTLELGESKKTIIDLKKDIKSLEKITLPNMIFCDSDNLEKTISSMERHLCDTEKCLSELRVIRERIS